MSLEVGRDGGGGGHGGEFNEMQGHRSASQHGPLSADPSDASHVALHSHPGQHAATVRPLSPTADIFPYQTFGILAMLF